jgi:phosphate:Na+ symporter
MTTWMFVSFAGGIGLFLLGMKLMTDGLKVAAGDALREILAGWTATPLRGVLSGVLITAMVQSSSAVIFATIGFVNAGLLGLIQAVGVIYGSNLGTTITSWLVALIGFKMNLQLLSLPAIALGMLLRLSGGARRAALGEALTGFGIFFMGIDVLKETFAGLEQQLPFEALGETGYLGLLLFVLIGILLTVAMQSSSAALAVTLTAAAGGIIPLQAAAAVVIGANVGTTSTAAFAVIGATPAAKRAALAHVLFNVVTGVAAFLALPGLLWLVHGIGQLLGLAEAPATALAIFHTLTKLTGLLLLWPATPMLVRFLEQRFRTAEEDESRPRHLDRNIIATPGLALDALYMEALRIGAIARRAAKDALNTETVPGQRLEQDRRAVEQLVLAMGEFTNQVQHAGLPKALSAVFPSLLRVTQYYSDMSERATGIAAMQARLTPISDRQLADHLARFKGAAVELLDCADVEREGFVAGVCLELLHQRQIEYQELKSHLLRAGSEGRLSIRQMVARLDEISAIRRMLDQAVKAAPYLEEVRQSLRHHDADEPGPAQLDPGDGK